MKKREGGLILGTQWHALKSQNQKRKENTKCGHGKKKKNSQSDDEYKFKRNEQTQYKNEWNKVYFSLRKVSMIN